MWEVILEIAGDLILILLLGWMAFFVWKWASRSKVVAKITDKEKTEESNETQNDSETDKQ
jgi:hypothetical protein